MIVPDARGVRILICRQAKGLARMKRARVAWLAKESRSGFSCEGRNRALVIPRTQALLTLTIGDERTQARAMVIGSAKVRLYVTSSARCFQTSDPRPVLMMPVGIANPGIEQQIADEDLDGPGDAFGRRPSERQLELRISVGLKNGRTVTILCCWSR